MSDRLMSFTVHLAVLSAGLVFAILVLSPAYDWVTAGPDPWATADYMATPTVETPFMPATPGVRYMTFPDMGAFDIYGAPLDQQEKSR